MADRGLTPLENLSWKRKPSLLLPRWLSMPRLSPHSRDERILENEYSDTRTRTAIPYRKEKLNEIKSSFHPVPRNSDTST